MPKTYQSIYVFISVHLTFKKKFWFISDSSHLFRMQGKTFLNPLQLSSLLTGIIMDSDDDDGDASDDGGMKVLTWLSAERRGMERVRPCPSIG